MPCAECTEPDVHNYSVHTFDLYLAEIDADGDVGEDVLVGNIVTGTLDDQGEPFDAFDALGTINEPFEAFARIGVSLLFTTDEITCQNLLRLYGDIAIAAGASDRIPFNATVRRKVWQVTLEHEMPCGALIQVRFHRACVVNRGSYLFSPDTIHGLAFDLRSFPKDDEDHPFGYMDVTPGNCATS